MARRGTGASIQGKVMLKLDPSALGKLLAGKRIAVVSGTNGKTTTTHFLAAALRESLHHDGNRLVHNADGATCITASLQRSAAVPKLRLRSWRPTSGWSAT